MSIVVYHQFLLPYMAYTHTRIHKCAPPVNGACMCVQENSAELDRKWNNEMEQ